MNLEKNWKWVVLVAVYAGITIVCTTIHTCGILYVAILERYPKDPVKASLIFSLNTGLLGICAPVITLITNRTSCRLSIVTGAILLTISGLLCAFIKSVNLMLLVYGILGGFGNALVMVPFIVVLGFYFNKRRDFVIALSISMIALGMLLAVPVVTLSLQRYTLDGSFLIIAAINAQLCIVGIICKPSKMENRLSTGRNKSAFNADHKLQRSSQGKNPIESNMKSSILRQMKGTMLINWNFQLFLLSTVAWNILFSAVNGHLPNYAAVMGESEVNIAIITTCFNAGSAAGRFVAAGLVGASKVDNIWTHVVFVGLAGVITLTFPFYSLFIMARYVFAALVGFFMGVPYALMTPISIELVGIENLATAHGLEYFYAGIGMMVGPPIAGALYGSSGSYRSSFILIGCIGLSGCVLGIATKLALKLKSGRKNDQTKLCKLYDATGQTLLSDVK